MYIYPAFFGDCDCFLETEYVLLLEQLESILTFKTSARQIPVDPRLGLTDGAGRSGAEPTAGDPRNRHMTERIPNQRNKNPAPCRAGK